MYYETFYMKLEQIVTVLGENTFLLGSEVSYPDFLFYDFLQYFKRIYSHKFDANFFELSRYLEKFEEIPEL